MVLQEGARLRGDDNTIDLVNTEREDGLLLEWPDVPESHHIIYYFLDENLAEVGRRSSATGRLILGAADPKTQAIFCKALAVAEGDTVARTAIVRLRPARE